MPLRLMFVPFLGGYISCPSHETPPEDKRERTERSVDGCRMKEEAGGEIRENKSITQIRERKKIHKTLENIEKRN